mgnify:CR=1 FL=1|jgi:hypothetical protein|tara:strand:+ start:315 stop:488 length:174 start_codon:yes stop_codon:yes gene_type:complete
MTFKVAILDADPADDSYTVAEKVGCAASLVRYYRALFEPKRQPGRPKGKPNAKPVSD